ncbi:MAG: RNA-directed DNA polymerase, partial [Spirochaetota bacterium]
CLQGILFHPPAEAPHHRRLAVYPGDDPTMLPTRHAGIPIGNLTSQFFANIYLDQLDHFVKERLGIKAYLRYPKTRLYSTKEGVEFLGYRVLRSDHLPWRPNPHGLTRLSALPPRNLSPPQPLHASTDPRMNVFKKIFGSTGHKDLPLHFLNELLPLAGRGDSSVVHRPAISIWIIDEAHFGDGSFRVHGTGPQPIGFMIPSGYPLP